MPLCLNLSKTQTESDPKASIIVFKILSSVSDSQHLTWRQFEPTESFSDGCFCLAKISTAKMKIKALHNLTRVQWKIHNCNYFVIRGSSIFNCLHYSGVIGKQFVKKSPEKVLESSRTECRQTNGQEGGWTGDGVISLSRQHLSAVPLCLSQLSCHGYQTGRDWEMACLGVRLRLAHLGISSFP